ncbi:MAG: DNA mismatch repair endonuclease MutL [Clostridia bacterium]|nr:DNA mismatch repair endonuclease MutL [Clostridia bacterium]
MGIINLLDAQTANMIAAGEVVDRPASALKELLENALDAGSTRISVDIRQGGRAFLRVTDNGEGFLREDMPKALLRHATSKIRTGEDLTAIGTFGFRGEALAAISSVSRMEILSRQASEDVGTRLTSDENGVVMTDTGCPAGTSVIVRDLFYNTPARQKFLKRDATEAAACVTVAEHAALSRPDVSFTVAVDGEKRFFTAGDGKLLPVIYALYGRDFASGLIPLDETLEGIRVHGFVTSPDRARGSRAMQIFFVNGRPVRSKTVLAALEEAFRSYLPNGRYPGAVLFTEMSLRLTDVNVHPAKLEIRFADERSVFSAVYYAVRNRLSETTTPETAETPESKENGTVPEGAKSQDSAPAGESPEKKTGPDRSEPEQRRFDPAGDRKPVSGGRTSFRADLGAEDLSGTDSEKARAKDAPPSGFFPDPPVSPAAQTAFEDKPYWKYIGEAYDAFLFVETEHTVYVIDKHAAHERILYEELASRKNVQTQMLLNPVPVDLTEAECAALSEAKDHLSSYGFELEPFGGRTILVRAVPSSLSDLKEIGPLLQAFAAELASGGNIPFADKCDRALFTVACKAAVKAGIPNDRAHNEWIIDQLMNRKEIRFCPHGRPVMHSLSRRDIEKYFDR